MPTLVIRRNQASIQNLVESTKLVRLVIDSKSARRKEEEKKERRKHKNEKREKSHKHSSKKADDVDKTQLLPSKKTSSKSNQLEKSDLTEELGEPQNHLGYLSDGSQNSKKRKRDASPPAVESVIKASSVAGNPLRIRLILKKPEDVVACSTSGADCLNHRDKAVQAVVCSKVCEPEFIVPSSEAAVVETKNICEPELPELNVPSTSEASIGETKKRKKHKPSKEDRYNALFDDWPPSSICFSAMEVESSSKDDDDWLFGSRKQEGLSCKEAVKTDEDVNMSLHRSSDSSWPRAQFLSQVGIYSLPYTVPF